MSILSQKIQKIYACNELGLYSLPAQPKYDCPPHLSQPSAGPGLKYVPEHFALFWLLATLRSRYWYWSAVIYIKRS